MNMITFGDYVMDVHFNKEEYLDTKKDYLENVGPMIQKIDKLIRDNNDIFQCGCCWVTDFGSLDGIENEDDILINIFTYNGMKTDHLGYEVDMDLGFSKNVNDIDDTPLHEEISRILGTDFYDYADYPKRESGWYRLDGGDVEEYYNKIEKVIKLIRNNMAKPTKYMWIASSNDGAYEDKSNVAFDTEEECYNDMRNAVLEKMKWNTNYHEDFEDDDSPIGYNVLFGRKCITHESYSGLYTYKIVPYVKQSAPRFIIDGLVEGLDDADVTTLEDMLTNAINGALTAFKETHGEKIKSLTMQNIQHLGI